MSVVDRMLWGLAGFLCLEAMEAEIVRGNGRGMAFMRVVGETALHSEAYHREMGSIARFVDGN